MCTRTVGSTCIPIIHQPSSLHHRRIGVHLHLPFAFVFLSLAHLPLSGVTAGDSVLRSPCLWGVIMTETNRDPNKEVRSNTYRCHSSNTTQVQHCDTTTDSDTALSLSLSSPSLSPPLLCVQIADVQVKIDKVEQDIEAVEASIKEAEQKQDEKKIQYLREDKKQLRDKEKQLRDKELLLLKSQAERPSGSPSDTQTVMCKI